MLKFSEKYQLLMRFYNELITKAVLPTLNDIKEIATEIGLPEVRVESRQKAISPLIGSSVKSPYDELIAKNSITW